jgi:hypothetical protein
VHIYRWSARNSLTEKHGQVPKPPIQSSETHDVRAGLPVEPGTKEILPKHTTLLDDETMRLSRCFAINPNLLGRSTKYSTSRCTKTLYKALAAAWLLLFIAAAAGGGRRRHRGSKNTHPVLIGLGLEFGRSHLGVRHAIAW